ncbi:MAG: four helix bundle protein [Deltaproteobacteria bacterium]|nr:four helix bundle protein [Deltaproteobacteria bacterium]
MNSYKELLVWQKSMALVTQIYPATASLPGNELYGLISQIRRSAVSIPTNIAEGYGRHATQDYIRFLKIARGSLFELQTLLEISRNLSYIDTECFQKLIGTDNEIERMLTALIKKLQK